MSREKAIEAGARALHARHGGMWAGPVSAIDRVEAAAVIDAALPHLASEPVGYGVIDGDGRKTLANSLDQARAWSAQANIEGRTPPYRVVALVPVEEA